LVIIRPSSDQLPRSRLDELPFVDSATAELCTTDSFPAAPVVRRREPSRARRDLHAIAADGAACSVMIGIGENYLAPFALALGKGELVAGLITSIPLVAGAVLQLITPAAVRRLGSQRRWVVACVVCQALSFVPLAIAAFIGTISVWLLFVLAALYWGSGMASGPAWTSWVDTLVPDRLRACYFGRRARIAQGATLIGFAGGGVWLAYGDSLGAPLTAFAILFIAAAVCRVTSVKYLCTQSEPRQRAGDVSPRITGVIRRVRRSGDGRLLVYLWAMQAAAQVASPYFAPFMLAELKFSYLKYMMIVSTSLLAKAVALPTLGRLARRFGAWRLLWMGGVIVIPLPLFWMISQATPALVAIQIMAGAAWATYELAAFLLFFEAIDARQRIGTLTLYNLGYATATVAGSLIGGTILALFDTSYAGYLLVFAASCLARIVTLPLLRRIRRGSDSQPDRISPATIRIPTEASEDLPLSRAA
jgi:MFS family permease